jgi:hypothetical protein
LRLRPPRSASTCSRRSSRCGRDGRLEASGDFERYGLGGWRELLVYGIGVSFDIPR